MEGLKSSETPITVGKFLPVVTHTPATPLQTKQLAHFSASPQPEIDHKELAFQTSKKVSL